MKRQLCATVVSAIVWFATPTSAQTPLASTAFDVGAAHVTKIGVGERPIILLPGLASGPYAFANILPELAVNHPVYGMTFAGFDGVAPVNPPYLDAYERSVLTPIDREHLVKPILIGHSLGGHLAVRIAETHPDLVGAVIVVDALPLFPLPQAGETPESRRASLQRFGQMIATAPAQAFTQQARVQVSYLVTAPKDVDLVVGHELRGDQVTIGGAAAEMMGEDLGPRLAAITAPLLVIAQAPDAASEGRTKAGYAQLYTGVRDLTVVTIAPAKHFVMLDQPALFRNAVTHFLADK
jgi:pimeloyl-ACP methyl ester carboxylesterase